MMRFINAALVIAVLVTAATVYQLEHQSRVTDRKLAKIRGAIAEEREQIRRLRAEWSHLNTPARLEQLATKHLKHEAGPVSQVIKLSEVSNRVPGLTPGGAEAPQDAISKMLDGNVAAIVGEVPSRRKEPDLIGNILKGLE